MSTPAFTARAAALADLRALQLAEAAPSAYAEPLATALQAITSSPDRRMQRRRQARHVRSALHLVAVAPSSAQASIDSAVEWIGRYP